MKYCTELLPWVSWKWGKQFSRNTSETDERGLHMRSFTSKRRPKNDTSEVGCFNEVHADTHTKTVW
jgi:hypothetical protein